MRCAALNRFPEDKHLILNRNVGLLQLVIVCIVHTFEGLFANTAGIQYHGSNGNAHRIVAVGLDPSAMGWKLNAYGAIDKRLNAGGKGSPFIRWEDFAIRISKEDVMHVDLIEYTSWRHASNCCDKSNLHAGCDKQ